MNNFITIIEIESLPNGAHRNQTSTFESIPEGYALVPNDMETKNFPFGDIEVQEIDGIPTVVSWNPLEIPEEPNNVENLEEQLPENYVHPIEQLRADIDFLALMTGVDL